MTASKVIPVVMPQAGNSMEEGTILTWFKKAGDPVEVGDILAEIETDKSTMELEATDAGRLARIVAKEGDIVPVKQPVAYLADNDADIDSYLAGSEAAPAPSKPAAPAPAAPVAAATATAPPAAHPSRIKASPVARKVARAMNIELDSIGAGSGPGGRILSADVERAASQRKATPAPPAMAATPPPPVATGKPGSRPMSKMRRAIGKALTASKQTVPHFYVKLTIDADPLFAFYRQAKTKARVSVNDVLVKACALTLQEFPPFRSRIEGEEIVEYPNSNIGIAVGIEDGLLVPVLIGVEAMSLERIGSESRRLAEAARQGKVENQGKGVFTISNLGMYGVEEFSAIINPPEASILAAGAIREEVVVRDGMMRPGRKMTMVLSCDHRIVDGAQAAQFLARLRAILEVPAAHLGT